MTRDHQSEHESISGGTSPTRGSPAAYTLADGMPHSAPRLQSASNTRSSLARSRLAPPAGAPPRRQVRAARGAHLPGPTGRQRPTPLRARAARAPDAARLTCGAARAGHLPGAAVGRGRRSRAETSPPRRTAGSVPSVDRRTGVRGPGAGVRKPGPGAGGPRRGLVVLPIARLAGARHTGPLARNLGHPLDSFTTDQHFIDIAHMEHVNDAAQA